MITPADMVLDPEFARVGRYPRGPPPLPAVAIVYLASGRVGPRVEALAKGMLIKRGPPRDIPGNEPSGSGDGFHQPDPSGGHFLVMPILDDAVLMIPLRQRETDMYPPDIPRPRELERQRRFLFGCADTEDTLIRLDDLGVITVSPFEVKKALEARLVLEGISFRINDVVRRNRPRRHPSGHRHRTIGRRAGPSQGAGPASWRHPAGPRNQGRSSPARGAPPSPRRCGRA